MKCGCKQDDQKCILQKMSQYHTFVTRNNDSVFSNTLINTFGLLLWVFLF